MRPQRSVFTLVTIVGVLAYSSVLYAEAGGGNTTRLVDGAVARHRAVFSGRFQYRLKAGFRARDEIIGEDQARFSFSGTSWARRHPDGRVVVNHDGKWLRFGEGKQPDGSLDPGLQILPSERLGATRPCPPYFAGSFWYDTPAKFIEAHRNDARDKGEVEVNGVRCRLLEWTVVKANDAFHAVNDLTRAGGFLRVYVAPDVGYALPRYEYVASNGVVGKRHDASEFREVAPGIFLPRYCSEQLFDPKPMYYAEYEITEIQMINEAIPEEDFHIRIPAGTEITDGRGKYGVVFHVGTSAPPGLDPRLEQLLVFEDQAAASSWRTGRTAILVGSALAVLLMIVLVWFRRHRRNTSNV
jgi:hypothetical protein